VIALHRVADASFPAPVRIGDDVWVLGEVSSLAAGQEDAGIVTLDLTVVTQDDQIAAHASVEVLWQRDEHFGKAGA
jgi:acyl dehydratase